MTATAGGSGARADVGVYGGSGLYTLLDDVEEVELDTPFGPPSAPITIGEVAGRRVAFLPRHGRGHTLPPHRVPYRANAWAMRLLGVRALFAPFACGSLQPDIHPGEFVVVDQIFDRAFGRPSSFHDGPDTPEGLAPVDHVTFAEPYDARLRRAALAACEAEGVVTHPAGTVVVIAGPRFSTRAESQWFQAAGFDTINMTQYPEGYLARELELCYANISMVTDHDVGVAGAEPVSHEQVVTVFEENNEKLRELLFAVIPKIGPQPEDVCATALRGARI